MKKFVELVNAALKSVDEVFPWDLAESIEGGVDQLLLDVREPAEFEAMRIAGSINAPRGILEAACEYGYEDTVPVLAGARSRSIVIICRSGNRSALAGATLKLMGFENVVSLKTGIRGWFEYDQSMLNGAGNTVDEDKAEAFFDSQISAEQMGDV